MKLNKRLAIIISVTGTLALLVIGVVGLPSLLAIKKLNQQIAAEYLDIESRYNLRRHTRASLAAMDDHKPKLQHLTDAVVIEGEELDFISALEAAASAAQVTQDLSLETVNQKDISPWEREIPIRVRTTGDYRHIVNYFQRLQALPYYISFDSLEFSTPYNRPGTYSEVIQAEARGTIRWFAKTHPILVQIGYQPSSQ